MAKKHPYNRVYELKGRSLAAARALQADIHAAIQHERPQSSGNMGDIQQSWQDFYARQLARLQRDNPALLEATGLLHAEIKVKRTPGHFARAYQEYPAIFLSPEAKPRYFMYVPVGHAGGNFVPADGILKTSAEEQRIGDLLFAGGWLGNAPIFSRTEQGVPLPPGLRPRSPRQSFAQAATTTTEYAYIADGASLAAVQDYEARLHDYTQKLDAAMQAVKAAVEADFPRYAGAYPHLGGFYVNMSASYDTRGGIGTDVRVSVRAEGGTPLPPQDSVAYKMIAGDMARYGEYSIVPRHDTAEGRALAAVLQKLPPARPSLEDYPALVLGGQAPHLVDQGAVKILRYFMPAGKGTVTAPADARPFDTAVLRWLMDDAADRRRGVTPPPMPAAVAAILATQPQLSCDSKPSRPRQP